MSDDAKKIIASTHVGSLGTIATDGCPFVTLVTVAAAGPTTLVMLLSGLAKHTQNLLRDPRCSLLLVATGGESGNPLEGPRLTIVGSAVAVSRDKDTRERETFLAKHPEAAMYADFGDFSFYRVDIDLAHLVAGFGRIETLTPDQLS
ncbi:MAG: pyridoxamine 5'-phosphate oxidase [Pirellulaceae bacterium]|nr:pyridoxamine 5'-phosphate oxidase [Pirellulaceae bacterium]